MSNHLPQAKRRQLKTQYHEGPYVEPEVKMSRLTVKDRVLVMACAKHPHFVGKVGTILAVAEKDEESHGEHYWFLVEFDQPMVGAHGGGCRGSELYMPIGKPNQCWWCHRADIVKVRDRSKESRQKKGKRNNEK